MRTLMVAALLTMALAGCTDNNASDPAPTCDPATHFVDEAGVCMPHTDARIIVDGLPLSLPRYQSVDFTWTLDNGTRGTPAKPVHSMDSRILVHNEDLPITNDTTPDDWGTEVAKETHKNLPMSFEVSFSWEVEETLYIKGYMDIDGEDRWFDLGTIDITAVQPTGNATTITISGTPPSLSESSIGIRVGDGVQWQNDNGLYGYEITFDCNNGVTVDPITVAASSTSAAITFVELTNCDYTAKTTGSGSGVTQGDLSGKINVNKP